MMKNKLLTIMLILLVAITLVGVIAIVVIMNFDKEGAEEKEPTIDEIIKASVEVPEITTNLASGDFIRMSLTIQTDSKKAKEELEKRDFQVKNILITQLSEKKAEDLSGKAGKEKFQEDLKGKLNEVMQEGQIEQVYITSSILQ
jgi:flagellar protein FliL